MKEIYAVAYPKSGITWLIHLLCDLLDSPQQDIPGGPVVGCWGARCDGGYVVRKSHDAYGPHLAGKTIVFTQRDPRDVIVSTYHYRVRLSLEDAIQQVLGNYLAWMDTWAGNYTVATRYRWLHDRPAEELRRIVEAITGTTPTDERIQAALERQSFENMTQQLGGDRHFMRRGVPGDWHNYLSREQCRRINKALGRFMLEQGFVDGLDWWKEAR